MILNILKTLVGYTVACFLVFVVVSWFLYERKSQYFNSSRMFKHLLIISIVCFSIIIMGAVFNLVAVHSNGGKMPVYFHSCDFCNGNTGVNSETHFIFHDKSEVRFFHLTDIFKTKYGVLSIGDILIFASCPLFITSVLGKIYIITRINRKRKLI